MTGWMGGRDEGREGSEMMRTGGEVGEGEWGEEGGGEGGAVEREGRGAWGE